MHRSRQLVASLAIAAVATLVAATTAAADSDLNGDGRDDLVVGLPDEAIAQVDQAGVINVIQGGANGLTARGDRLWDQADLSGTVEANDRFGNAIAYGDFDGDGRDDVAIGAPTEAWNGERNAGVVHVIYGSSSLSRSRRQIISQSGAMAGKNEDGDFFGAVLAAGDFDNDGRDDLAIGAPGEDISGAVASGGVGVVFGAAGGLNVNDSIFFSQKGKVPGRALDGDAFGAALAVGDFNDDNHDDLAIGIPGKDLPATDAGAVVVLYGRTSGINRSGSMFHQGSTGLDNSGAEDWFGYSLAAGDFDNDGDDDLAVGIRFDDTAGTDAGAVAILSGGGNGVSSAGAYQIVRSGAAGAAAAGDEFGYSLAAADLVGGGADDLVIGAPQVDIGGAIDTGSVYVLTGSNAGPLSTSSATVVGQGPLNSASDESGDRLGESLRTGDFNGDGNEDLVVSSPFEDVGTKTDSGVIYVIYSNGTVLDFSTSKRFHQGTSGIKGKAEADDKFGTGL